MDTGPDVTRIVRSWLHTDEHESADRVLGVVLDQLDTTRQRRPWWPARRIADMNTYAKLLIAAAAVVVVAVVGINLLPGNGGVGSNPSRDAIPDSDSKSVTDAGCRPPFAASGDPQPARWSEGTTVLVRCRRLAQRR